MKLNYDFYKGNDEYSDGDIEKELIDYMKDKKDEEYNSIFNTDMRWPVFYHLTQIRENILNWYPMKKDAQVLEIGAGMGAITGVLCKKAGYVTAVELSKQRATAIATRHKNKENLEIILSLSKALTNIFSTIFEIISCNIVTSKVDIAGIKIFNDAFSKTIVTIIQEIISKVQTLGTITLIIAIMLIIIYSIMTAIAKNKKDKVTKE